MSLAPNLRTLPEPEQDLVGARARDSYLPVTGTL